jgi:hypothetical protein
MTNINLFGTFTREGAEATGAALRAGRAGWVKFEVGVTRRLRVLPPLANEQLPWVVAHQHFVKINGTTTVVNCPAAMMNQRCPVCEKIASLEATSAPADAQAAKEMRSNARTIARVIDRDGPQIVQLAAFSSTIMQRLSHFRTKLGIDFTNAEKGQDIAIERLPSNPWYQVDLLGESPLARDLDGLERIAASMAQVHLEREASVLTYAEIVKKISDAGGADFGRQIAARPSQPALSSPNKSTDAF